MSGVPPIDLDPPPPPEPTPPKAGPPAGGGPPTTPPPTEAPSTERQSGLQTRQFVVLAGAILLAAIVAFGAVFLLPVRYDEGPGRIVILLVAGLVALTLLLYFGTIIHRTVGLGSPSSALGMPEGSIRALIALSLVLLFAIIGITVLYSGIGNQQEIVSTGLTSAQIDDLENVQIISISLVDPAASPGAERYTVVARPEISQAGHDFGLQLLTTVSTLVVAVAGFYFGSKAVSSGSAAALAAVAQRPPPAGPTAGEATEGTGDTGGPAAGGGEEVPDELDAGDLIPAIEDDTVDEVDAEAEVEDGSADAAVEGEPSATAPPDKPGAGDGKKKGAGPPA
jgi:hypothetical protein